jgi:hypothetical protein
MSELEYESWWNITAPTVSALRGGEHPLPGPRHRFTGTTLWRLVDGPGSPSWAGLEACARCYMKELPDRDRPGVLTANREQHHHWLVTQGATHQAGFKVLGAAGFTLRSDLHGIGPFMALSWAWLHPYSRHRGVFRAAFQLWLHLYKRVEIVRPTTAVRVALVGLPTLTLTNGRDQVLVYTDGPECPTYGPMIEESPGAYCCRAKLEGDSAYCKEQWHAPAPRTK